MSRSGANFFECFTERISACGERHGLSRGGYPPLQMSRVIAERISVALFFHGAVYLTPSSKPYKTAAFPHGACTAAILL